MKKTTLLCILDGWGHREEQKHNAIAAADTPNWDQIAKTYPRSLLYTSGEHVGLPEGQMGNSEVGHMNIGCGRVMLQLLPRINKAVREDTLTEREGFKNFVAALKESGGACHLLGIISDGGVHGHMDHVLYLARKISALGIKTYIHAFLDGRDTAPRSAAEYLEKFQQAIASESNISLATICGRYYGMDRDNNWDRVEKNYHVIAEAVGQETDDFVATVQGLYEQDVTDEFIKPHLLSGYEGVKEGDGFFMTNYRADRARQIIRAFLEKDFAEFDTKAVQFAAVLGMAEYSKDIDEYLPALFPAEIPENTLADILEEHNLKQLHIAETEKYAHVTFFFNGGLEDEKKGEKRILIPSPDVKTYDLQPEMSAPQVTDELVAAIKSGEYDFIVVNFANPDMVGHSGVWDSAVAAVTQMDKALGVLEQAILAVDGQMLVTADHGNIECMYDEQTDQPHTAHTLNPVPFVIIKKNTDFTLKDGKLCDIAPTILQLMNLKQPVEMTGESLIK